MSKAIIQVDANNFYASCEQMIDPSIRGKGLVILSNNDGCIIARSSEARKMGIPMGQPYFKLKDKLKQLNIIRVFELPQHLEKPFALVLLISKLILSL